MAYNVIKRVKGRAYRYQVESFRDPDTKKVRGRWTYMGRVDGEGTLSPANQARPNSRARLLMAIDELFETTRLADITTNIVSKRAGLAYGTFYRYFRDIDHIVREALLTHTHHFDQYLTTLLSEADLTKPDEKSNIALWINHIILVAKQQNGCTQAWYAASNKDPELILERQRRFDTAVDALKNHIAKINNIPPNPKTDADAYTIIGLCTTIENDSANNVDFTSERLSNIQDTISTLLTQTERPKH